MHVECGRCNAQGAQGAPSALGRQIFFPDEAILAKLHEAGLFVKPEKCEFEANKTTFLGFVISHLGIAMDPENVSAVLNWEVPKKSKLSNVSWDLRTFTGDSSRDTSTSVHLYSTC